MPEMKDSGIEWIGEIPKEWSISKLKYELSEPMKYGASETGIDYAEDLYRYIRITDITTDGKLKDEGKLSLSESQAKGYILKNDTVLFARSGGTVGKSFLYKKDYGKSAFAGYLISAVADNKKMYPKWLMYYTGSSSYKEWTNMIFNQATIQNIGADKYSNMQIPIAPLDEQNRIIDFLDSKCSEIDALTADIQKEIEVLEEYKKSVVFDIVSRGVNNRHKKKTDSDVWSEIPENWKLMDIKYLFEIVKRIAGKEGYDVLSVTQKGLKVKDITSGDGQLANSYAGYQYVNPTDYVMNHMDLLTGWVDLSEMFGVTSPDYRVFRLRDKLNNNLDYYKYVMQCCYMNKIFYSLGQGVSTLGRWRLQTSSFNNFKIPVPPIEEQMAIADYLNHVISETNSIIETKENQLTTLEEYKKSVIYEYVTGKKEVTAQ